MKATINVYQYKDLDINAKSKVIWWLDKYPTDYDCEDENGNTIKIEDVIITAKKFPMLGDKQFIINKEG